MKIWYYIVTEFFFWWCVYVLLSILYHPRLERLFIHYARVIDRRVSDLDSCPDLAWPGDRGGRGKGGYLYVYPRCSWLIEGVKETGAE